VAPTFEKLLNSEVIIIGGRVQLICIVKGEPAPTITWYYCRVLLMLTALIFIKLAQ